MRTTDHYPQNGAQLSELFHRAARPADARKPGLFERLKRSYIRFLMAPNLGWRSLAIGAVIGWAIIVLDKFYA